MSEACRTDGRCQYAIDHGAEGLGHCPSGKCVMPESRNRPTDAPGGMECQECGCIFIGAEQHSLCGVCVKKAPEAP